jgi:protein-S-isoprenylcysteine O-methyltransferase Ste14
VYQKSSVLTYLKAPWLLYFILSICLVQYNTKGKIIKNIAIFIYGVFSYIFAFSTLVWFLLYIGGWDFLPYHIDSKESNSLIYAIFINLILVILFALQHSIMARKSFKTWISKYIPKAAERSTYVLVSGIFLALIFEYWQSIDLYVWQVDNEIAKIVLISLYIFGWSFSTIASFLINHFELFGLQQVYLNLKNRPEPQVTFTEKYFYKVIRHPIQLGTLIGIWATPKMSYTHLMLSITFTIYIFIGLYFEEKDLVQELGDKYKNYQQRVSMMIPFLK